MGYAKCGRLPEERQADAVRFSLTEEQGGSLLVRYACERSHQPVAHGELVYLVESASWREAHSDGRIQRMAECYVRAQLARRQGSLVTALGSQPAEQADAAAS